MPRVRIIIGSLTFHARYEEELSPLTCAEFQKMLPFRQQIIHARWSGEACWIPLGDLDIEVGYENATSHPSRGDILFYPGGISETEILIPYGSAVFACKAGQLAGNHFLTITDNIEALAELGHLCLWHGAQDILFESIE